MPLQSTRTIEKDGKVYPYYTMHLAISPLEKGLEIGGSVAMRLTPYRVEDGVIDKAEDLQESVVFLDVFEEAQKDEAIAAVTMSIMGAIQNFINDKGI